MSDPVLFDRVKSIMDQWGLPTSVWYPIALAESNFDPNAMGDNGSSVGLFQLNTAGGQGAGYARDALLDPVLNAEIAARSMAAAFQTVKDTVPPYLWASETARRSGHPGGSIGNPFDALDPRIQNIADLAGQFMAAGGNVLDAAGAPARAAGDQLTAARTLLENVNGIVERLQQFDWVAAVITMAGAGLILIAVIGMLAESKTVQDTARTGAALAVKAAAA